MQEVDDFIGKTFKHLTVVGWDGERRNGVKVYTLFCSKCATDPELFGDGKFKATKYTLTQGKIPCGCGVSPKWTDAQYKIKVQRVCDITGYIIKSYSENFNGGLTKLTLECPHDNHVWNTTYRNVIAGYGCRKCNNSSKRVADKNFVERFLKTGSYLEGTAFTRTDRVCTGGKSYWQYTCPVCSHDKYVANNLCTGVFELHVGEALKGSKPCRCSDKIFWTQEQREFQVKEVLASDDKYKFLGWLEGYKDYYSKLRIECDIHGEVHLPVGEFVDRNRRCKACAVSGFKENLSAYFYILQIYKDHKLYAGYGITNNIKVRINSHRRNLKLKGFTLLDIKHYKIEGTEARLLERKVKDNFEVVDLDVEGFRREATEAPFNCLVDFVEQLINKGE